MNMFIFFNVSYLFNFNCWFIIYEIGYEADLLKKKLYVTYNDLLLYIYIYILESYILKKKNPRIGTRGPIHITSLVNTIMLFVGLSTNYYRPRVSHNFRLLYIWKVVQWKAHMA